MEEGIYTVREVRPSDENEEKDVVFLDVGMSGFLADTGKFDEGDDVRVEKYETYRGNEAYRVAEKVGEQ